MSVPGNINTAPPPSSFDDNTEFYEESRWQKLRRRLLEEPLIPLGCALTCWALYEATKSMKSGDKYRTNRMFRRRIYAQGFTILAMVGGSAYWESDRAKRKQYEGLVDEKKKKEKHEAWLRELEARDAEETELRKVRDRLVMETQAKKKREQQEEVRSVLEECEERRQGPVMSAVRALWEGRR